MRLRNQNLNSRYLIIGVWNTCFGVGNFLLISYAFTKLSDLLILAISYFISIVQAHFSQRKYVWKSKSPYLKELFKFSTIYLVQYPINALFLVIFCQKLGMSREFGQLIITVMLIFFTFFLNRFFVFRKLLHTSGRTP